MKILNHNLELKEGYVDTYKCLTCGIDFVHFTNVDGENMWRYMPNPFKTLTLPKLTLTCEEQQIKNLLE